jgi:ectoine hydroxylase-related dioxygenase (phytanoyl-CoA dioxygenase family)
VDATNLAQQRSSRNWLTEAHCDLDEFRASIAKRSLKSDFPFAADFQRDVPIYDCDRIRQITSDVSVRAAVMAEWAAVWLNGPGIIVLKRGQPDAAIINEASDVFRTLIDEQKEKGSAAGDHFAKPGANDRVWNALEKLCIRAPEVFARYYANEMIAIAATAWLGPAYQIASQLNVVNPGGVAQAMHRDYHLGFFTSEQLEHYPAHVHRFSPALVLQGAVAHCDMPVESGPTLYLPYSQRFEAGYFAGGKAEFQDYFNDNHVQLPLEKGDIVFFSPALFHAAGTNRSRDIKRMANLLQITHAFARPMETVDRVRMCKALYPVLKEANGASVFDRVALTNIIAAAAEGYAFPTNLDRDPPIGGLAPDSDAVYMLNAIMQDVEASDFGETLEGRRLKRQSH